MPLVQTRGAASAQGFGEFAQVTAVNYIENVFSTYLWTGDGTSGQTINNGIDLAGKGGLMWMKPRTSTSAYSAFWNRNQLYDTVRGINQLIASNTTDGNTEVSNLVTSVTNTGFTIGATGPLDVSGVNYVGWTFRKQPKFFDIVTYTGNGSARTIAHNLGSTPGCIIVKCTNQLTNWAVYHRSLGGTYITRLNTTGASETGYENWANTDPTSTVFTVGNGNATNGVDFTYVAYIFAHDAGGFGLTGTDNVISCGSYTGNGSTSGPTVTLGYEPQWLLIKNASSALNWYIVDNMRGFPNGASLFPNDSTTESNALSASIQINATGFTLTQDYAAINANGSTYIYIAIRRGPMKVPTSGTSVFGSNARTGTGANATVTGGQTDDLVLIKNRGSSSLGTTFVNRLVGANYLDSATADAEVTNGATVFQVNAWDVMDGVKVGTTSPITNASGNTFINYLFKRAPSFYDTVCYTGTLANLTLSHNLGVAPELMIVKCRSSAAPGGIAANWAVYAAPQGNSKFALLNTTDLFGTSAVLWQATTPTASNFYVGAANYVNGSGETYVAHLFGSVAGVSKVGTYTGTGALLTVDCGFTSGARFVLIKRADTSGDWWVYDSARGISSGNDPYLFLNSTAAEVTGTNYVDTDTTGFKVTAAAPAGLNASGGTYIFLAIA